MGVDTYAGPYPAESFGVGTVGQVFTSANASVAPQPVTNPPVTVGKGTNGAVLVVTDLEISVGTTMVLTFTEESSGIVVGKVYMLANTTIQLSPRGQWTLYTAGMRLMVQASTSGNVAVGAHYYSKPLPAGYVPPPITALEVVDENNVFVADENGVIITAG